MSRRLVWTAVLSLLTLAAWCGAASAQYAGNGYPDRYYYEYDQDPGYGGGSVYRPFDYPQNRASRGYSDPQAYSNGYDQAPPEPRYVDPGYGAQGSRMQGNGGPASDYDLGPSIRQRTVTEVANETRQPAGTIVIDTASRYLYFTQPDGRALRYGIGVGRQGFAWKGTARVARKAEWPDWVPPSDMLKRRPDLPLRMSGGMDNPLGARAMYLYQGNRDTMFRIHGTNEPDTIGKAVSSGCIRMMNGDVIDLYSRVPVGTKVVVL